jgi:hypothetical protein
MKMEPEGYRHVDDRVFGITSNEGYVPTLLEDYDRNYHTGECNENNEDLFVCFIFIYFIYLFSCLTDKLKNSVSTSCLGFNLQS